MSITDEQFSQHAPQGKRTKKDLVAPCYQGSNVDPSVEVIGTNKTPRIKKEDVAKAPPQTYRDFVKANYSATAGSGGERMKQCGALWQAQKAKAIEKERKKMKAPSIPKLGSLPPPVLLTKSTTKK